MSKTESLPKEKGEQEVDAGPQLSLAPTCPSPLLRKISQKLIHSNAVNLRHLHSSSKADPTDLSWHAFSLGRGSSKKISIEQVKLWWRCVQYSVSRCLHLLSPPWWEPPPFPKSHTHPSPYPRVQVLPSAGFHHSLPIDTLITVGHVQKIVFLVVVLGEKRRGKLTRRNHSHHLQNSELHRTLWSRYRSCHQSPLEEGTKNKQRWLKANFEFTGKNLHGEHHTHRYQGYDHD